MRRIVVRVYGKAERRDRGRMVGHAGTRAIETIAENIADVEVFL